jgi:phenylacetate-CoA ligase
VSIGQQTGECCDSLWPSVESNSVANLATLADIESDLGPPQINSILEQGVAATVAYVREKSPFYREKFAGLSQVRGVADLARLPVTTKEEVSKFNKQFWCVPQDRVVDIATTSGTTGVPTLYPLTQGDLNRLGMNEFLCFRRVGLSSADVAILAVTIDRC